MDWLKRRLLTPATRPGFYRGVVAVSIVVVGVLMLWAGISKGLLLAEGPTKPPESWGWQEEWKWPPASWKWPPRNADGTLIDADREWPPAPYLLCVNNRVIDPATQDVYQPARYLLCRDGDVLDRNTYVPLERSGIDRVSLVNVVHQSLRRWIPLPPSVLVAIVAVLEAGLGLGLIFAIRRKALFAWVTVLVIGAFSVLTVLAMPQVGGEDCACFGGMLDFGSVALNIGRNAIMMVIAGMIAWTWAGAGQPARSATTESNPTPSA